MKNVIPMLICLFLIVSSQAGIIYVDADANGADDGSSWANAYNFLQDALSDANSDPNVDEIRVAQGTYTPDSNSADPNGSGDRTATFQLINGVAIYGGFPSGGDPNFNDRDHNLYRTVLSGDLDGNDVDVEDPCDLLTDPTRAENSYHVVSANNIDATAVLDGFTITAGNANISSSWDGVGGGMFTGYGYSPTVVNCTFRGNSAIYYGGGIFTGDSYYGSLTRLTNCRFVCNWGGWGGGVHCLDATLTNCTFSGNSAILGGGMVSRGDNITTLTNCTFIDNSAEGGGGMHNYHYGSIVMLTNCTFSGNSAIIFGGGLLNEDDHSRVMLTNCSFSGNSAVNWGGGMFNGGNSSPMVTNCTFSGNSAGEYGGGIFGLTGTPILINCTMSGNSAGGDGGGMWSASSSFALSNCILWANSDSGGVDESAQVYILYVSTPSLNYNCIQAWTGNLGGIGNIGSDPCFVDLGYWNSNGTPGDANDDFWIEGNYHLLPFSLCIDAGDPNYIPEPNETDIDGNPRVINGRIDMGAYETNYIQAAMKLTPQTLNCASRGNCIKAHLTLPEEFSPADVDVNEPAVAEPMGAESEYIKVFGNKNGLVKVEAAFDPEAFCDLLSDDDSLEVTVIGSLTTGQYFYGTDTIRIKPRR